MTTQHFRVIKETGESMGQKLTAYDQAELLIDDAQTHMKSE